MRFFMRKRKLITVGAIVSLSIFFVLKLTPFSSDGPRRQKTRSKPYVPLHARGGESDLDKDNGVGNVIALQPREPVPNIDNNFPAVQRNDDVQRLPDLPPINEGMEKEQPKLAADDDNKIGVNQLPEFPVVQEKEDVKPLEIPEKESVLKVNDAVQNEKQHSFIEELYLFPQRPPSKSTNTSKGPGEGGAAYVVDREKLSPSEAAKYDEGWKKSAFDNYVSDAISVRRYLPDFRDGNCKTQRFLEPLPQTAVIICFHNEAWTTLLRSVHSVIDNSPPELLKEIVLVDDASDLPHLKDALEEYMAQFKIVKIVRAKEREGLIRARMMGVRHSTAPILTFLDSHIECTTGWLKPLIARIAAKDTNVVVPIIEVISDKTFQFKGTRSRDVQVGGFDWNLIFHWHTPPQRDKRRPGAPYSPLPSPTMAGGLFSISRAFFKKLGYYDEGMEVWGGENLELSFKTWMCGGTLETIVCSHVGHVFRARSPYKWASKFKSPLRRNTMRLAHVWLDEYKRFFLAQIGNDKLDYGDISDRIALRNGLKCQSFKWYLDNIYPELFVPSSSIAHGDIENKQAKYCIDGALDSKFLIPYQCHKQGGNQFWLLSPIFEMRRDSKCWDSGTEGGKIYMEYCHGQGGNQLFRYDEDDHIRQRSVCVELSSDMKSLSLQPCSNSPYQEWKFDRGPYMAK